MSRRKRDIEGDFQASFVINFGVNWWVINGNLKILPLSVMRREWLCFITKIYLTHLKLGENQMTSIHLSWILSFFHHKFQVPTSLVEISPKRVELILFLCHLRNSFGFQPTTGIYDGIPARCSSKFILYLSVFKASVFIQNYDNFKIHWESVVLNISAENWVWFTRIEWILNFQFCKNSFIRFRWILSVYLILHIH